MVFSFRIFDDHIIEEGDADEGLASNPRRPGAMQVRVRKYLRFGAVCGALLILGLGFSSQARAGNPVTGLTLFTANGCLGCHAPHTNAANAPNVISYAISTSSGGAMAGFGAVLSATDRDDIAAYLNTLITNPTSVSTSFNTAKTIAITNIDLVTTNSFSSGVAVTGPASHGTVLIAGLVATYTPDSGYFGTDSFSYAASGPAGSSSTRVVNVAVGAPGAPTATNKSVLVTKNTATPIDLTSSIAGASTSVLVLINPANGTTTQSGNIVTYTPTTGYTGTDSFTYVAVGPGGASGLAVVNVTVSAAVAPAAVAPVTSAASFTVPSTIATPLDLANSIAGVFTSVSVASGPSHGSTSVIGSKVTYTPATGYSGADSFTYIATGPGGVSSAAIVSITVSAPLPPAPTVADKSVTTEFNIAAAIDLTSSISGQFTSIALGVGPTHGTTSISGNTITFTPSQNYVGADSFTYTATGPGGTSTSATVHITVTDLPPVAGAGSMTVTLNASATLDLTPLVSGSALSGVYVTAAPLHGTTTVNGLKVTYIPNHNYFGTDAFSYVVYGRSKASAPAVVSISVVGRPDAAKDPALIGLISSQVETARRFSRSQISNFQARLESLHHRGGGVDSGAETSGTGFNSDRTQVTASRFGIGLSSNPQVVSRPTGAAYQPGASLNSDSNGGLAQQLGVTAPFDSSPTHNANALRALPLTLSYSTGNGDGSSNAPGGIDLWIGGGVKFGVSDAASNDTRLSFRSDGVSFGADRRFSDKFSAGIGLGYAQDNTDIGTDGTNSKTKGSTIAVYGSYQPTEHTFIDGVIGLGSINYLTNRFVPAADDFAHGDRSGNQMFGSLTSGYEFRAEGLNISPYGRLDYAVGRLHQVTETGAGNNALTYAAQSIPTVQGSLGVRADLAHEANFGVILPRMRVEFQHDFRGQQQASVSYADVVGGPNYIVNSTTTNRNSVVLGIGSDLVFKNGLNLSFDYQAQRSSGQENNQAVFFKLVKTLDGKELPDSLLAWSMSGGGLGIHADVGYTFDDNVTRSSATLDKLSDSVYDLNLSKQLMYSLGSNTRMFVNGFLGLERFHTYVGLGHANAGGGAELQYRNDGEFGTPIYALFANATYNQYETDLRDGHQFSVGLSIRKPLTDRISIFGALTRNMRYAESAVFDDKDTSARLNIDYAATQSDTLYIGGEYRHGDIVSSGSPSLRNIDLAEVFAPDDAFTSANLYAYRFDGKTAIFTLGYNFALSTKDSLDFSWRSVQSKPGLSPSIASWKSTYRDNQFSIVYLTSF